MPQTALAAGREMYHRAKGKFVPLLLFPVELTHNLLDGGPRIHWAGMCHKQKSACAEAVATATFRWVDSRSNGTLTEFLF